MKLITVLTFLTLLYQRPARISYGLIGYRNGQPVFATFGDSKPLAFQLEDSLRQRSLVFSQLGVPMFINNCTIAFFCSECNYREVVYETENEIKNFKSALPIVSLHMTDDCQIMVASVKDTITIFNKGLLVRKMKGQLPTVVGNYMYFCRNEDEALIDLYRVSLLPYSSEELVLAGIYWSGILPFDDGKYIACYIGIDGNPKKAIYNTSTKSYLLIDDPDFKGYEFPVFLPRKNTLIYYDPIGPRFSKEVKVQR